MDPGQLFVNFILVSSFSVEISSAGNLCEGQFRTSPREDIDPCPPNQVQSTCKCEGSCANPSCSRTCTDITTCVCPTGYLMLNDDCVPLQECGCYMRHEQTGSETVLPEGETYTSPSCDKTCVCKNDYLICNVTEGCDPKADCEYRDDIPQCYCRQEYIGDGLKCYYSDCTQLFNDGENASGVYQMKPTNWTGPPFEVYCDMTNGGGWTVFQRQMNDAQDFYLYWSDYKAGFGNLSENFWLGNEKIYSLTKQRRYELRVDMINVNNVPLYAVYDSFNITDESQEYTLRLGNYVGDAGNALSYHNNFPFTTRDNDNDDTDYSSFNSDQNNLGVQFQGGWWYRQMADIDFSSLNSPYGTDKKFWLSSPEYEHVIRYSDMKIRAIA
ncbi:fibrinogen-like protein A [Apostichopus japonicus]|uniref:fibrinogen-like protein A n=1 Tax=Stichopus japonicus TaxID=307972 RepID=UPI003AB70689